MMTAVKADFAECVDFFVKQHYHWACGDGN